MYVILTYKGNMIYLCYRLVQSDKGDTMKTFSTNYVNPETKNFVCGNIDTIMNELPDYAKYRNGLSMPVREFLNVITSDDAIELSGIMIRRVN